MLFDAVIIPATAHPVVNPTGQREWRNPHEENALFYQASAPSISQCPPAPKIIAMNEWIEDYAAKHGHVYVDYHSAMKDQRGGLPAKLSENGVHPLPAGYEIMAPLAQAGIEKLMAR